MAFEKKSEPQDESTLLDGTRERVRAYMYRNGSTKDYDKFLLDHKAMRFVDYAGRKDKRVMRYPIKDMVAYEKDFLSKLLTGINDSFIFEKIATEWTTDHDGKRKKTGYFIPRMFWDYVKRGY